MEKEEAKISMNPNDYAHHKVMTNVFLFRTNPNDGKKTEILLGLKKRGWMTGSYNGFGGKVLPGESIDSAAHRELIEGEKEDTLLTIVTL
jgi:hypothetical protein